SWSISSTIFRNFHPRTSDQYESEMEDQMVCSTILNSLVD
ncbi:hypothetical protein WG66_014869, partial [Moniliophthora roreri]